MERTTGIRVSVLAITFGLYTPALLAQARPANEGELGTKVAVINLRLAIANTAEGKQAEAQIETEFLARRKELEELNNKINDIQRRLQAGGGLSRQDEEERLNFEGKRLMRQLEHRQNEYQEDLNDARSEVLNRIGRRMGEVVRRYAPKNGYGTVLDNSSQTTPVMYASADITQEVVKLYDEAYPVKSGGAAGDGKTTAKPMTKPSER